MDTLLLLLLTSAICRFADKETYSLKNALKLLRFLLAKGTAEYSNVLGQIIMCQIIYGRHLPSFRKTPADYQKSPLLNLEDMGKIFLYSGIFSFERDAHNPLNILKECS